MNLVYLARFCHFDGYRLERQMRMELFGIIILTMGRRCSCFAALQVVFLSFDKHN